MVRTKRLVVVVLSRGVVRSWCRVVVVPGLGVVRSLCSRVVDGGALGVVRRSLVDSGSSSSPNATITQAIRKIEAKKKH